MAISIAAPLTAQEMLTSSPSPLPATAALGWLGVAALLLAVLLATSALTAAGVLYLLGWLLDAVLGMLPG
jgi:hypothetical protein